MNYFTAMEFVYEAGQAAKKRGVRLCSNPYRTPYGGHPYPYASAWAQGWLGKPFDDLLPSIPIMRQYLDIMGYTYAEAGSVLGLDPSTIGKMARGQREPSDFLRRTLSKAL